MAAETIGFAGLGQLGGRMATRLADAGHRLIVFDADHEQTHSLVEDHGARAVSSPRALAAQAKIVFTCLPSEDAAREALLGENGIVEGLVGKDNGIIECSTLSPTTAKELGDRLRQRGAQVIDASVSGSTIPAEKGELVFLVGGDRELYERCLALFEPLAKATFFMGDSGAGATSKLVVNTMLGVAMQGLAEAWALGINSGLDPDRLAAILSQNDTVPVALQPKIEHLKDDEYPTQFALRLMHKDFALIADLARAHGVFMPAASAAAQVNAAEQNRDEETADLSSHVRPSS
jgi:3-hydroxyisobutyrate dehydrogenase-like beta-hydroxyacid dehydrogenase